MVCAVKVTVGHIPEINLTAKMCAVSCEVLTSRATEQGSKQKNMDTKTKNRSQTLLSIFLVLILFQLMPAAVICATLTRHRNADSSEGMNNKLLVYLLAQQECTRGFCANIKQATGHEI